MTAPPLPSGGTGPVSLRPYQLDAVERVRAAIRQAQRRILIVAPTGAGKTVVASYIIVRAVERGHRVLFLAHRRELIAQTYRRLIELGLPESEVGVLMAADPRRRPAAPVQVASIDTLRNRAKPLADIVIVDEAHRALAESYQDVAAEYPQAIHLGLTATPYRADGRGLGDAYDALVLVASVRQLIADGFLVEPRVFTVPASALPDLGGVRVRGGDYDEAALAEAVDRQTLIGNIVEHWKKHADGVRTVAFAVSVAHSKHIVECFREAGVPAEHLDGTTPTTERDAILARLESGQTLVVANCGVLCEGWDSPPVKCAILARPTQSTGLYLQQAGRILRPWEGQRAIILDHGGLVFEHGLPQDDRDFSLHQPKQNRRNGAVAREPQARVCPACFAVLPVGARVCPECHTPLATEPVVLAETDDHLVEYVANDAARGRTGNHVARPPEPARRALPHAAASPARRALFERFCAESESIAWARLRYRIEVGALPPREWE